MGSKENRVLWNIWLTLKDLIDCSIIFSYHRRYSDEFYCYLDMRNPYLGDNDKENLWNCYLYVHTMET